MIAYVWTLQLAASYFWVTVSGASTNFTLCFEDHCYLRSDSRMSWVDAVDYCFERDAVLPSIHSSEQNEYISVNVCVSTCCWIGLTEEEENVWVWVDGTDLNYKNWNAGEPKDNLGKEDHAHFWDDGTWNDNPGTSGKYVICMRSSIRTRAPSAHPTKKPTSSPSNPLTFPPTEDPTTQLTFDPSKWPTSSLTADPTTQPTFNSTKWSTLPPTAQSKSSVLVVVLVSQLIITLLLSIAVCVLCCWVLPIVRRDARNKRESEKLGSVSFDDETLRFEVVPISPDDDTYEGCTTTMELIEEKNHGSPVKMELQESRINVT